MEIWKDVKDYEGIYQVSNFGNVKSLKRKGCSNDRMLKPVKNGRGYLLVGLYKNGINKTKFISTLVAIAFLNHKPNGHKIVVDHINNIKTDNEVSNLQLISQRENTSKDKYRKNTSSKYVGVVWHKLSKKWRARIVINGKQKHLGCFTSEINASEAYQKALNKLEL